jgi:4-hydroxybutyrate CoA-transferase
MIYQDTYKQKLLDDAGAIGLITDGCTIATGAGSGLPNRFLQLLAKDAKRFSDVRLCHAMRRETLTIEPELMSEENEGHIFHVSDFSFDRPVIDAVRQGRAVYRPNHPTDSGRFFPYDIDLLVVTASPMDKHGYFSLGAFGGWIHDLFPKARKIVLEVNKHQPRVHGNCSVHVRDVAAIIEADYPLALFDLSGAVSTEEEKAVAKHVAGIVKDGATLQIGVGSIPDSILKNLQAMGVKDLGIHSEAMFDSVVTLYEAGVVTNARKTIHKKKFVCALGIGSPKIYDFLNDNPAVEMHRIAYVADPRVFCQNYRPFAINATIMVDLSGQCASETIGHQHYSGVGGQWNFHYGASLGEEGCGVMTLLSTAKGGTLSNIVPMLPLGSAVSISRNDIQYVATEYGIVNLKGSTLEERALKLISIAHPKFRDELTKTAREQLKVLPRRSHVLPLAGAAG